ncbi:MAG: S-layer protein, partial [Candidatus Nanohaloarchaeota archaeon QJJ-9]|nr:S-layer protein [Candidatus Nanohaloarchaeota archaeon QJJ-9]
DTTLDTIQDGAVVEVTAADGSGTLQWEETSSGTLSDLVSVSDVERTAELPSGVASNDAEVTWTFSSTSDYVGASLEDSDIQYGLSVSANALEVTEGDSDAKVLFTQPENDDEVEEAYALDITLGESAASIDSTYTGDQLSSSLDGVDVDVAYDDFGAYSEEDYDSDDSETFTLNMPAAQATAGMAMTGPDGELSASGVTSSDESVTYTAVKNPDILGSLTDNLGVVDAEADSVKDSNNLVLVGGPAVNSLVQELASENKTRTLEEWRSGDYDGEFLLQTVDNAFSEGYNAMIVAGHAAEDTKAAAKYIGNYKSHADELEGKNKLEKGTTSVMN